MNPKRQIQKLIEDLKTKKFREGEAKELTKTYGEEIKKQLTPAFEGLSKQMTEAMKGQFAEAVSNIKVDIPKNEAPQVSVNVPETVFPDFPEIPAPIVRVAAPIVNIPEFKFPEEMSVRGWVSLMGVDMDHPLPVQLRDADGKPVSLSQGLMGITGGGGKADFFTIKGFGQSAFSEITNPDGRLKVELPTGSAGLTDAELRASSVPVSQVSGATDSVYVTGAAASTYAEIMNPDGRVKVELPTGSSGLTDTELRASSLDVQQASGAVWSVSVNDIFRTTVASSLINSDDRLRVSLEPGGSGLTDAELRASRVYVEQVSGANWSVVAELSAVDNAVLDSILTEVSSLTSTASPATVYPYMWDGDSFEGFTGDATNGLDVDVTRSALPTGASTSANQDSQTNLLTTIDADTGAILADTAAIQTAVELIDDTVATLGTTTYTEATTKGVIMGAVRRDADTTLVNTTNEVTPLQVDANGYLKVEIFDGGGSHTIDGSVNVNGSLNSVLATGTTLHDAVDTGDAPLKIGGVAVTSANPTAVAGGDRVNFRADDLGRQITRPVQVRDLISTAYATLTNGTATTLFAGATSTYHDLIYILASNTSTAAVGVDLRATAGGNVMMHLEVPANGTVGVASPVPIPAGDVGATWTADMDDITGTTVHLSALFSKEI